MKNTIFDYFTVFDDKTHTSLYALVILVILDYISGICLAVKAKQLSSKIGAHGLTKKVMIFALVALSAIVDRLLLNNETVLYSVTLLFYCTNEIISILENAKEIGLPLPKKLISILERLQSKE